MLEANATKPAKPAATNPGVKKTPPMNKKRKYDNGALSPMAWGFVVTLITVCMCLILILYFACLTMSDVKGSSMHKV